MGSDQTARYLHNQIFNMANSIYGTVPKLMARKSHKYYRYTFRAVRLYLYSYLYFMHIA